MAVDWSIKQMDKYVDVLCDVFYMIFISASGVFIAFWAAVFFIGSPETMQRLIAEQGIALLFLKRFIGFAFFGVVPSLCIALISLLVISLSKKKDFKEPLRVFVVSAIFQAMCALIGSTIFAYGIS